MSENQDKLILIVEDEPELAALLSDYLSQSEFQTRIVANGLEAIPAVQQTLPTWCCST